MAKVAGKTVLSSGGTGVDPADGQVEHEVHRLVGDLVAGDPPHPDAVDEELQASGRPVQPERVPVLGQVGARQPVAACSATRSPVLRVQVHDQLAGVLAEHLEHVDLGPGLPVGRQQPERRPEALTGRDPQPGLDGAVGEGELGRLPS